ERAMTVMSTADFPPTSPKRAVCTFEELARRPDDEIDVALGAALVARDVHGNIGVAELLDGLDALAEPLLARGLHALPADEQTRAHSHHVYEVLGFRGNESEYYDPRNSLLSDVLERRLGIPISLAMVYCEIARRVGVPARGVGFPGHFLVRIDGAPGS